MYKYLLETAGNINWMAIFALLTFVFMFIIGSVTILRSKPEYIEKMANMPLEDNHPLTTETSANHEE
jgi:uncharacterized membrane protein